MLSALTIFRSLIPAMGVLCLTGAAFGQQQPVNQPTVPPNFKGRLLVVLSDADMVASAYSDGKIGPVQGGDALSVVRLDRPLGEAGAVHVPVSNSVTGPPALYRADGKLVYADRRPRGGHHGLDDVYPH